MTDLLRDLARARAALQLRTVEAVLTEAPPENPTGFTDSLERICAERGAEFGDPPCWRLPELVEPCDPITPCEKCMADARKEGGE